MKFARVHYHSTIIVLSLLLSACSEQKWETLFNGENLEGWSVKCIPEDEEKIFWKVEDGCITCNSMGNGSHNYVWLASEREFSDFHLKLKFQVYKESGGNSGVQFRSVYDDSDTAEHGGWLNGPQVDIHGPTPFRTGLIYDETQGVRRWIHPSLPDSKIILDQAPGSAMETSLVYFEEDPEAWNKLEIICEGMTVKVVVNGNALPDFDGEGILNDESHRIAGSGEYGCIALQLHIYDELKIRYKDIWVKDLGE